MILGSIDGVLLIVLAMAATPATPKPVDSNADAKAVVLFKKEASAPDRAVAKARKSAAPPVPAPKSKGTGA